MWNTIWDIKNTKHWNPTIKIYSLYNELSFWAIVYYLYICGSLMNYHAFMHSWLAVLSEQTMGNKLENPNKTLELLYIYHRYIIPASHATTCYKYAT